MSRIQIDLSGDVGAALRSGRLHRRLRSGLRFKNFFKLEHWRGGKLLQEFEVPNGIVDVGLHYLLETGFRSGTAVTTWYLGLVDNSGFSAFANADTMSSHAGWNEFTTYSQATRPTWSADAAASRAMTNSTTVDFSITGSGTLKGLFATSNNTKSGTTGTLWATAAFSPTADVVNSDTIKATYSISG